MDEFPEILQTAFDELPFIFQENNLHNSTPFLDIFQREKSVWLLNYPWFDIWQFYGIVLVH